MCVAILTTGNTKVPEVALRKGWNVNPDGGGLAYIQDGKVVINKGLMSIDKFLAAYDVAHARADTGSSMLLHFRIGTSGRKGENNTHPFEVKPQKGPKGAMIHNGVLFTPAGSWTGPEHDRFSDTRVLVASANNILVLEDVIAAKARLGMAIGSHNKLVFLYDNNEHVIINEDKGFWHEGAWYSNGSCGVGGRSGR